jgi:tetrahydromethanopterin S-methyltransferase subunit G
MMLDPMAPIRYKGFGAMPEGIGSALAVMMAKSQDTKMLVEMIRRDVFKSYYEVQGAERDDPLVESSFREIRNQISQMGLGFGLERALYELNDSLPCQSPLVGEAYVVDIKELLPGLNGYGATLTDAKQWPCDRHIAAFIGARARSDVDRNLVAINDSDKTKALMALLNMLAVFQYRLGPESMPGLASWVVKLASTMVEGYNSRDKRKEFEGILPKLAKRGSVVEIYQILDDPNSKEKDANDFAWAQAQYMAAEEAIKRIESQEEDVMSGSDRVGKQVAAVTGILIGMLVVTIVVILKVW